MSADGTDIRPIPPELRTLGALDTGLLWGNLGVSLLVVVAGAILVPALSLPQALVAIVVGCVIGNAMLARRRGDRRAGGRARDGADARAARQRGSYLPTAINVVQCLGWTVFELIVIATAAAALSDELFGFERAVGLDDRLRRGGARARAARPGRRRPAGRAARRRLGRARVASPT